MTSERESLEGHAGPPERHAGSPIGDAGETSVTTWLGRLKDGDSQAGDALWQRYLKRLIGLARHKLADAPRRAADEEDVVQSAFNGFLRGVEQQRFPQLENRDDLWQVLVMLTERKAIGQKRYGGAAKRGEGRVRGESAFGQVGGEQSRQADINHVAGPEPAPDFAVEFADYLGHLFGRLQDEQLREVALAKLEGYTNREIAAQLDLSLRAVERKLHLIRRTWGDLAP
jgi:DNA-directed RNA polymerase specialized sigma24 family protein